MGKVLRDIWIITRSGIVLFNRVFDETIDSQLFGGLLSAINTLADEVSSSTLTNFELSQKRFTLLKRDKLIFVVNSDKKTKQKRVDSELNSIAERFVELYGQDFDNFDGEISHFNEFKGEIEDSLESTIKRFEEGFW